MAGHRPFRELTKNWSPERLARVAAQKKKYEEEMVLEQVRQAMELTQVEVGKKLGLNQANVSRIEKRADLLLSTLRNYVHALGGELVLCASIPGLGDVRLKGLGELRKVE